MDFILSSKFLPWDLGAGSPSLYLRSLFHFNTSGLSFLTNIFKTACQKEARHLAPNFIAVSGKRKTTIVLFTGTHRVQKI